MNQKGFRNLLGHVRWAVPVLVMAFAPSTVVAQRLLTLDSCRVMALQSNKQMGVAKVKQEVAKNLRKSARTKYLPHVSAVGTYQYTSKPISLLSDEQKVKFSNLGTTFGTGIQQSLNASMSQLPMEKIGMLLGSMGISMDQLKQVGNQNIQALATMLNATGQEIVDALDTDTRNLFAGSVMAVQPLFMGGSIIAMNKMADLKESMAKNSADASRHEILYSVDQSYWLVVSLKHKKRLAEKYLEVVKKLDDDVQKMIAEGVATRSDGLSVDVKVNEAEMTLTKVDDGLVLARMLLCQRIGLPVNEQVVLADEDSEDLSVEEVTPMLEVETAIANRPELKLLQNAVDISHQMTNVLKAGNLPTVALTGGYSVSNPNLFNGFRRSFGGFWNVGVLVRVPIWNWGDVAYKVRAAKGSTAIANLEMAEAREKIELQVTQNTFRVDEANKKLRMARTNIERADENLRMANLGFQEGVITPTTVMEAQTAWLQAQSQKIDAEIDCKLSQIDLRKSLGTLD